MVLGLIAAVTIGASGVWYLAHRGLENTDNAQIDGDVVSVPARIGGVVTRVAFIENRRVKAGELLAELEAAPAQARLAEAEANVFAARAQADAADAAAKAAHAQVDTAKAARDLAVLDLSFMAKGALLSDAQQQAFWALNGIVNREALVMSFNDTFFATGILILAFLPLVLLLGKADKAVKVEASH